MLSPWSDLSYCIKNDVQLNVTDILCLHIKFYFAHPSAFVYLVQKNIRQYNFSSAELEAQDVHLC